MESQDWLWSSNILATLKRASQVILEDTELGARQSRGESRLGNIQGTRDEGTLATQA